MYNEIASRSLFLLLILCVCDSYIFNDHLNCLQHNLGTEVNGSDWEWTSFTGRGESKKGWLYSNGQCPLHPFNEKQFCVTSIGCGNKVLLVGDSTMQRWADTIHLIMDNKEEKSDCPTRNGCADNAPKHHFNGVRGCIDGDRVEHVQTYTLCEQHCPPEQPVTVTFIRHDYISNHHGPFYFRSCDCDQWKILAPTYDIVLLSIGGHVHEMVEHPYGEPAPAGFNHTAFFQKEAEATAELVASLIKPTATVVYRTSYTGDPNHSPDCARRPLSQAPEISTMYHWHLIPELNRIYMESMKFALKERLLIMNTMMLLDKMQGCRKDFMHFDQEVDSSPVLLEWTIFHNILREYKLQLRRESAHG